MTKKRILTTVIIIIAAIAAFAVFSIVSQKQSSTEANKVLEAMEKMIPYLDSEQHLTGMGREDLAVISVNDVDVVGVIEIPSLDLRAPVASTGVTREYFATLVEGSPTRGYMRITGDKNDVFSNLADGKPGERVTFIDVDGIGYDYTITTQVHLKNWDEADYDLLLTYRTDKDTEFVLGCTASE